MKPWVCIALCLVSGAGCGKTVDVANSEPVLSAKRNAHDEFEECKKMLVAGSTSSGLELLAKLIKSDPENAEYRFTRAKALLVAGKHNEGKEDLSHLVYLKKNTFESDVLLCETCAKLNDVGFSEVVLRLSKDKQFISKQLVVADILKSKLPGSDSPQAITLYLPLYLAFIDKHRVENLPEFDSEGLIKLHAAVLNGIKHKKEKERLIVDNDQLKIKLRIIGENDNEILDSAQPQNKIDRDIIKKAIKQNNELIQSHTEVVKELDKLKEQASTAISLRSP